MKFEKSKKKKFAEAPAVSRAPAPIRPLSPSGPDLTITYKIEPPNWERWKRVDRVLLWQAACLASNFEPPAGAGQDIWTLEEVRSFPAHFHRIWEAVNGDEGISRRAYMPRSGRMLHHVNIGWFANWALQKGFELPAPLEEIASSWRQSQHQNADKDEAHPPAAPSSLTPQPATLDNWTGEELQALLNEHSALKVQGSRAPTLSLAGKHNLSETRIRELLRKARGIKSSRKPVQSAKGINPQDPFGLIAKRGKPK